MKKLISLLLVAVMVLSFGLVNASAEEPVTIICYTNDNANNERSYRSEGRLCVPDHSGPHRR